MPKIQRDIIGLYTTSGGYIVRPHNDETKFKEDDKVKTYHHGGSTMHSVRFDGEREYWYSQSLSTQEYKFAKNHYFKTEEEFNNFLFKIDNMKNHHPLDQEWQDAYSLTKRIEEEMYRVRREIGKKRIKISNTSQKKTIYREKKYERRNRQ